MFNEFLAYLSILIATIVAIWLMARKQKPWSELTEKEKKTRIVLIIIGILLFAAGIVAAFLYQQGNEESILSQGEALTIAQKSSDCSMAGVLTDEINYNAVTKTWWIDLERMPELEKDGCNPACVVSEETKTAEVNWRCTGLVEPEE